MVQSITLTLIYLVSFHVDACVMLLLNSGKTLKGIHTKRFEKQLGGAVDIIERQELKFGQKLNWRG